LWDNLFFKNLIQNANQQFRDLRFGTLEEYVGGRLMIS
jgi:hypothetical protein